MCRKVRKGVPENQKAAHGAAFQRSRQTPGSVVVLKPEVGDELLAFQVAERVLQLHGLNEQIVLRIESRLGHGRFQIEAEPLLYADATQLFAALRQVQEQNQVEHNGRREDGIAAEEVNLELHWVA